MAHGVVEGQTQNLDKEVDGVASEVSLGPAPIAVFDQQSSVVGQFEVASGPLDELESAFLEQGDQRGEPGGTDLVAGPAWSLRSAKWGALIKAGVGHSLSSSGVE